MAAALEIRDLEVSYHRRGRREPTRAVVDVSLDVARGRVVALVGETGCGKSSLARAAVGLVAPTRGTVRFEGEPVRVVTAGTRPARQVRLQLVFQNPYASLNPRRTVGAQIADGL